jgi:quinol monooxygenase YgiN
MAVKAESSEHGSPFAITVAFELVEGAFDEFHRLASANAAMSVAIEPQCLRFDVLTPLDDAAPSILLYEIYADRTAFDRHLAADHYLDFDAKTRHLVTKKTVMTFTVSENAKEHLTACEIDAVALFGTAEPPPTRRLLKAGRLTAILEEGNLRTISFGGAEAVRAINYLARDGSWGTYKAALSNLTVEEDESAFSIAYDALCYGPDGRYAYRMTIRGEASGRLTMEAVGEALTDFPTNRTGFVVLHPSQAAGGRLTIRHGDGTVEETVFPDAISPDQPAFDIVALTHEPAPGLTCTVAMEGDAFEMEDQRNWADASFKTYIRPLSKPRPYTIAKGARGVQRVAITVEGQSRAARDGSHGADLTIGGPVGRMPSLALFLAPEDYADAMANVSGIGRAQSVIVRFDPMRGHDSDRLAEAARFAAALGATLSVEAVFDARDPRTEAAQAVDAIATAKVRLEAVLVAPRREFRTRPSNTLPLGERPAAEIVSALRATGLEAKIGAGTPSFFTEFNRNPPAGDCDLVFFSIASNVHAADDLSVMETVGVYPTIISSARKLCPGKPIWLGPCTIGMRHNPYGAGVAANPEMVRKPGAAADPRHGALFGAAFAAGVAAAAAEAGVERLVLAAPTGPFGLVDDKSRTRPIHAVHAILSAAAGAERFDVSAGQAGLAALGFYDNGRPRILLANLSPDPVALNLPGDPTSVSLVCQSGEMTAMVAAKALDLPPCRTALVTF